MDSSKEEILKIFEKTYGKGEGLKWLRYWRVFFMASEELFAYDQGREWYVSHYLLKK
jgi:cyclopropane-fatty-acyl-phospholipid synthase